MTVIASVRTEVLADAANPQLLVHVTDSDGVTGIGETWWGHYLPNRKPGTPVEALAVIIDTLLTPVCLGAAIDTTEQVADVWHSLVHATYQYGDEGMIRTAISGIDIALWDLLGCRHEVPVTELLGGHCHQRLPVYASLDWRNSLEAVCADAQSAMAAGFTAVKLHESDAAIINGARDALGPDVRLMVDVSAAYAEAGANELALATKDADLTWLEEPLSPQRDHAALARVRSAATMPIAAGENEFSLEAIERLLSAGAVDIVQPEIAKFGGLTPAPAIGALAASRSVVLSPHNFSMGPSFLASWHWAMTEAGAEWLEIPWLPHATFPCGLAQPPIVDGAIGLPTAPGLGMVPSLG